MPILPLCVHALIEESFVRLLIVVIVSIISAIVVGYVVVLSESERILVRDIVFKIINKTR